MRNLNSITSFTSFTLFLWARRRRRRGTFIFTFPPYQHDALFIINLFPFILYHFSFYYWHYKVPMYEKLSNINCSSFLSFSYVLFAVVIRSFIYLGVFSILLNFLVKRIFFIVNEYCITDIIFLLLHFFVPLYIEFFFSYDTKICYCKKRRFSFIFHVQLLS